MGFECIWSDIILCGPKTLIPDEFTNFLTNPAPNQLEDPVKSRGSITISRSLEESIKIADAIIVLRLQKERMMESLLSSIDSYSLDYGLTQERLSLSSKTFQFYILDQLIGILKSVVK